jgi:hypothetical protein
VYLLRDKSLGNVCPTNIPKRLKYSKDDKQTLTKQQNDKCITIQTSKGAQLQLLNDDSEAAALDISAGTFRPTQQHL